MIVSMCAPFSRFGKNLYSPRSSCLARTSLATLILVASLSGAHADEALPQSAAWLDSVPRELYDLDSLGETLKTPRDAFTYVRDHVAYEPYSGVMKGAVGTFLTHGGNDFDRALLLARLLTAQSVECSFAHGKLSDAQVAQLTQASLKSPTALDQMAAMLPKPPANLGGEEGEKARTVLAVQATQRRQILVTQYGNEEMRLSPALRNAHLQPASIAVSSDHVWVRATIDGKTVDLDPSLPDQAFGTAITEAVDTWSIDGIPDEFQQRVQVRVVAEQIDKDGKLTPVELLKQERTAASLGQTNLRFSILPKEKATEQGNFFPVLLIGDELLEGSAFRLFGEVQATDSGPGGLFGGFGGGEITPSAPTEQDPNAPHLARLAVEFAVTSPDGGYDQSRRVIIDRVIPNGQDKWKLLPELAADESIRPLLAQIWDVAVDTGAIHLAFQFANERATLNAIQSSSAALGSPEMSAKDLPTPLVSPVLLSYSLASALVQEAPTFGIGSRFYLRPRLLAWRRGFAVSDWSHPSAQRRQETGIDLLNAPFAYAGENPALSAMRSGIVDTVLERYTVSRAQAFNTVALFEAAGAQKIEIVRLDSSDAARLQKLTLPVAVRNVLQAELDAHRTLLLPAKPVEYAGTHAIGWWSMDPKSGYTVGKMELGGSQALVEAEEIHEKVGQWSETFVKLLGNIQSCYMGKIEEALGSVDYAPFKVKLNHGNDLSPSTDDLVKCLKEAICKAIVELASSQINSVVIPEEIQKLKGIEMDLADWMGGKASDAGCSKDEKK